MGGEVKFYVSVQQSVFRYLHLVFIFAHVAVSTHWLRDGHLVCGTCASISVTAALPCYSIIVLNDSVSRYIFLGYTTALSRYPMLPATNRSCQASVFTLLLQQHSNVQPTVNELFIAATRYDTTLTLHNSSQCLLITSQIVSHNEHTPTVLNRASCVIPVSAQWFCPRSSSIAADVWPARMPWSSKFHIYTCQ